MIVKNTRGYFQSSLLIDFPFIHHGFTSSVQGDCKNPKKAILFLQHELPHLNAVVMAQQVHSAKVEVISAVPKVNMIPDVDGLFMQKSNDVRNIALGVRTADCVPILLYDPRQGSAGVVHAGWRGTINEIVVNMIRLFQSNGSDVKDIFVLIGPHICASCYTVEKDRALLFSKKFESMHDMVYEKNNVYHLDLGRMNRYLSIQSGIDPNRIDITDLCTCHGDEFYSFRKDTSKPYDEQMGFMAFSNI